MLSKVFHNFTAITFVFVSFLFIFGSSTKLTNITGYSVFDSSASLSLNYYFFLWFILAGIMMFVLGKKSRR